MKPTLQLFSKQKLALTLISVFIFLTALWLYTSTTAPGLSLENGDFTELQRASYRMGIARSTGYPIYTILGYLSAQLGEALGKDPYTWVTYSSAFTTAIALVMFFHLALLLSPAPIAIATTLLLMFSNTVWQNATVPDVQGLNSISIIGMLWMMLLHLKAPERLYPLVGAAFFAGLGLANHRTSGLVIPVLALAMVFTGAVWRLKWRWLILIVVGILPILSYSYLYFRANTDPHVVFSTRPTWFPAQLGNQQINDLVIGKNQTGQELSTFFKLPTDDFTERFNWIKQNITGDLGTPIAGLGVIGLCLLSFLWWRFGVSTLIYTLIWLIFLMGWRLEKGILYQVALVLAILIGLLFLLDKFTHWILPQPKARYLLSALVSIPLFASAFHLYTTNRPIRDLHNPAQAQDGRYYYEQMATLPPDTILWTLPWSSETFILLEYMDTVGRRDILPRDTALWWVPLDDMQNENLTVYISPTARSMYNLFNGATWFQEETGLAFSGTASPLFLQVRPKNDARLIEEADAAILTHTQISPEIELYSYTVNLSKAGIHLNLYWKALAKPQNAYSVYTHLRFYETLCSWEGAIRLLEQDDSYAPVKGAYPTWLWDGQEIVKDTYLIAWPKEPLPNSGLGLTVGLTLNGERNEEFCLPFDDEIRNNLHLVK